MMKLGSIGSYDSKIDRSALLSDKPTIKFAKKEFDLAKTLDSQNEKRPSSPASPSSKSKK